MNEKNIYIYIRICLNMKANKNRKKKTNILTIS